MGDHQMSENKNVYVQPSVELLGSEAEKTQSGNAPFSDVSPFQNNTAFPPPS